MITGANGLKIPEFQDLINSDIFFKENFQKIDNALGDIKKLKKVVYGTAEIEITESGTRHCCESVSGSGIGAKSRAVATAYMVGGIGYDPETDTGIISVKAVYHQGGIYFIVNSTADLPVGTLLINYIIYPDPNEEE